jgi:aryl-alcohol dehydrogenase-like predicted oxidoreductase
MFNGLVDSLNNGCNVLDSCRNFRAGRSEVVAGQALNYLINKLGYHRNNFFLSSKAGYVRENLSPSINSSEVVNDHCVHPIFLKAELEQSLQNLGVKTLDVYYLNNFAESQM